MVRPEVYDTYLYNLHVTGKLCIVNSIIIALLFLECIITYFKSL